MSSESTDGVGPPPVHVLQALQDELDLVLVGPPPQRTLGPGL